ncbi:MAG: hypothetical protein M3O46_22245 [Myxococcota bacterium]|nr:hypothetical protein [Myxococcota bacterium]
MPDRQVRSVAQDEIERIIGDDGKLPSSGRIEASPSNGHISIGDPTAITRPRPDLAGRRLVRPGHAEVYVIDPQGYRRRIPNHTIYNRLFRSWSGIADDPSLAEISSRPQLTTGTVLIRGDASARIYLLDEGLTRLITDATVMDKYWFGWTQILVVRQELIEHIPAGPDWR